MKEKMFAVKSRMLSVCNSDNKKMLSVYYKPNKMLIAFRRDFVAWVLQTKAVNIRNKAFPTGVLCRLHLFRHPLHRPLQ